MGTIAENNALKMVLIELFKKDKPLFFEVYRAVLQDDPNAREAKGSSQGRIFLPRFR